MWIWLALFLSFLPAIGLPAMLFLRVLDRGEREKLKSALAQIDPTDPVVTTRVHLDTTPPERRPLERLVDHLPTVGSLRGAARDAVLRKPATLIAAVCLMTLAGVLFGSMLRYMLGPIAILLGALAGAALPFVYVRRAANKFTAAFEEQLPDALEFLSRSVRTGNALAISMEMLIPETSEPLRSEFQRIAREQALGASLEAALKGLVKRVPILEVRFFVAAVLLHRETGGNLGEILMKLSRSVRERLRLKGQVRAASAQGRLTALVLSILPIAVVLLMNVISPEYFTTMTRERIGRMMLVGALLSQVIGYCFMKSIVNIEV
jgi:tight adherence protein B